MIDDFVPVDLHAARPVPRHGEATRARVRSENALELFAGADLDLEDAAALPAL